MLKGMLLLCFCVVANMNFFSLFVENLEFSLLWSPFLHDLVYLIRFSSNLNDINL